MSVLAAPLEVQQDELSLNQRLPEDLSLSPLAFVIVCLDVEDVAGRQAVRTTVPSRNRRRVGDIARERVHAPSTGGLLGRGHSISASRLRGILFCRDGISVQRRVLSAPKRLRWSGARSFSNDASARLDVSRLGFGHCVNST